MVGRGLCKCVSLRTLRGAVLALSGISSFTTLAAGAGNVEGTSRPQITVALTPLLEATPDAVRFVNVPVGDTYTQSVRITNVSEGTFQIKEITPSSSDFRITGILLPVVVACGTSESFTVSYRAKAESRKEGQIRIVTSAGDTFVLRVKALGATGQTELTANQAEIDFGDVAIGSSSKKEVLLTNSGNRELRISRITASGADFSVSGAGAVNLGPGQSISLEVGFAPKTAGRPASNLMVASAEGGSLLEIPLTATGAASAQGAVRLNWEESPVSVEGYVVYRSAEPSGPYTRVSAAAVPSPEYVDTGLVAGHTYYYVVTYVGADQTESEYSPPISATVPGA